MDFHWPIFTLRVEKSYMRKIQYKVFRGKYCGLFCRLCAGTMINF